jgi:predicted RNase H-like HicB family nuclease
MIFHVILEQAEDGWIVAEVPALPGCVSQGKDEKDALDNIKEAIIAWLWAEDQKAISALPPKQGARAGTYRGGGVNCEPIE